MRHSGSFVRSKALYVVAAFCWMPVSVPRLFHPTAGPVSWRCWADLFCVDLFCVSLGPFRVVSGLFGMTLGLFWALVGLFLQTAALAAHACHRCGLLFPQRFAPPYPPATLPNAPSTTPPPLPPPTPPPFLLLPFLPILSPLRLFPPLCSSRRPAVTN